MKPRAARSVAAISIILVTVVLCVLAPLRQTSGDTIGGRVGGAALRCGGDFDLARVDWIRHRSDANKLLYWMQRDATGELTSIFGPAPSVIGAVAVLDFGEGSSISDHSLRVRERFAAAVLIGLAALLLFIALPAWRAGLAAALIAVTSFAGAATLGQGLWQATIALPFLVAGLALVVRRADYPRLAVLAPACVLLAVMVRPTIFPLAFGIGIAWSLERRPVRSWLIAAAAAVLASSPIILWNLQHLHTLVSLGQWHGNTRLTEHVFVFERGHIGYALGGLLVSPGRGLLWYAPITLVGVVRGLQSRNGVHRSLAIGAIGQLVLITLFFKWYGGLAFGPRLLSECVWIGAYLAFANPPTARAARGLFAVAILVTALVGQLGLWAFRPEQWETRRMLLEIDENALWDFVDSPIRATLRPIDDELATFDSAINNGLMCRDGQLTSL